MRLVLSFPPVYRVMEAAEGRTIALGPDLVVTYGPVAIASEQSPLAIDVPPGAWPRAVRAMQHDTIDGWTFELIDAELVAERGVIETRLYACFRFLAHRAVAVVRAASMAVIDAQRTNLIAAFERARPEWSGTPICLAEVYDLGAPDPALALRDTISRLYLEGRHDEAAAAREQFRSAWAASRDPRVRLLDEYVFDRFVGDGFEVEAIEALRPVGHELVTFRAMRGSVPLQAAVVVETSEIAREAGTPYVIGVAAPAFRAIRTHATLPPYTQLMAEILPLLETAMRAIS
jgi:hypothetical protein